MGTPFDFDLAIIGGGAAGLSVAAGAAQLGVRTLLVEREAALGGDCLHYGCVPSKALLHSARLRRAMATAGRFGLPQPTRMPPVDFARVAAHVRGVVAAVQAHDSVKRFTGLGATVRFGAARFADEHTIVVDGKRITAARLVLATGSSAAAPPFQGAGSLPPGALLTNREIFSLDRLPASLIVLGAGPVGVEMAQAFARFGTRVTLVQRSDQILSREDRDMADVVLRRLWEEGVEAHLGATVRAVRPAPEGVEVDLELPGGGELTLTAEKLLAALGRRPNVFDLGLENAGVRHDARGVRVDRRLRTSQRHIFAAGDVTGAYQFTHAAGYEASVVVANAVFRLPRRTDYRLLPWCTYTEPELASVGLNEKRAREAGIGVTVRTESFAHNDRALAAHAGEGLLKLVLDRRGRPVGAQIVGPHAGELINEWVAALGGGVRLAALASAPHPYPTLGEISKRAAGAVLAEKLFSERTRGLLRLLFRYRGPLEDGETGKREDATGEEPPEA
ncbi:MAG: FAD-dependent oxidoreductase [Desulfovibrionaceae bacterium]|jgi:pyruvate/2-oxoglutarate dehydrogenase complex dihydrolipoamide dehydrogenase (E3) component|nr:FAD-dependent oxidoreductase [Desulfovibrionaceae bacterium]